MIPVLMGQWVGGQARGKFFRSSSTTIVDRLAGGQFTPDGPDVAVLGCLAEARWNWMIFGNWAVVGGCG